jgi:hypothetical protein
MGVEEGRKTEATSLLANVCYWSRRSPAPCHASEQACVAARSDPLACEQTKPWPNGIGDRTPPIGRLTITTSLIRSFAKALVPVSEKPVCEMGSRASFVNTKSVGSTL